MTRPCQPSGRLLSILVPVYNEAAHFEACMERVLQAPLPPGLNREVILVDDASTDGTTELVQAMARQHPAIVRPFFQPRNRGKGAAIRRAIDEMRGDVAIFQDVDFEYDPADYRAVLAPLLDGTADVVYGSRFAGKNRFHVTSWGHACGNLLLTALSNLCTGLRLTDMETCYKAFRVDILRRLPLRSERFTIEPEITAWIARLGCRIQEVPIRYRGRGYDEGKKIGWKDGFAAIYVIIKCRLNKGKGAP